MHFKKGHSSSIKFPVRRLLDPENSLIVSPRFGVKYGFNNPYTKENIDSYYREVLDVRKMVEAGEYPHDFMRKHYPWQMSQYPESMPQPLYSEGLRYDDPQACADVVHMDNPFDLVAALQSYALSQGGTPSKRHKWSSFKDFVGAVPSASRFITRKQDIAVKKGFRVKYYHGVIRPEEMYDTGTGMTAYEDGCPCHPSFPAGHGCLAGAAAWAVIEYYDLPWHAVVQIRNAAYAWSMWRTLAGVHYAPDNIAGLEVGKLVYKGYTNERYKI